MSVTIRLLKEGEQPRANALFNSIYGTNRSLESFSWEFEQAPAGKAIYVIAVDETNKDETKVVGIQCAIPIELRTSSGEILLTAKSEDTLVDPAYRGQKIFERMYDLLFDECKKAGIHSIWGFTPAEKAFTRLGFTIPFKTKQALAVFDMGKAYSYLASLNASNTSTQLWKIRALCAWSWIKAKLGFGSASRNYSIRQSDFSQLNDHFHQFYHATPLYNLNLSSSFIRWRLEHNPHNNGYRNYEILSGNDVIANVVINIRKNVSYIEQILTKERKHFRPAVSMVVKEMRASGVPLIRLLCFDHHVELSRQYRGLDQAGFKTIDRGNFFVWKQLSGENIDPRMLFLTRLFTQGNL